MTQTKTEYKSIEVSVLKPHTGLQRPYYHSPNPVTARSSALEVMTDLKFVPAATVLAEVDVASASQLMIARGVRLLLVVDRERDVVGLVTARDILGDRPAQVMAERGVGPEEVLVHDVMTPGEHIEVLEFEDVLHSHVGDIVETLKNSGRQHALVVDHEPFTDKSFIRAIFSASQIARQLGIPVSSPDLERTFREIDTVLKQIS